VKNPTVKKIFACVAVLTVLTGSAQGAYKVEIDDDTYVSDEIYFAPVSTWDEVKAQRINLKQGKVLFYAGKENEPYKIAAEVMPLNTTNKKITYKSEDITIATVDENGVVTPTDKIGDTFIDIRCGNALSKLKVSVVKGVEGVAMSQSEMTLYADKPITAKLTAMVSPTDATIQKVRWYSDDESIATVDSEGLVSPCGVGTTDIYAKTEDGDYTAKCTVTVTTWEKRKEDIPVVYTDCDMTVDEMVEEQMTAEPTVFTNGVFPASEENVEQYVNPENKELLKALPPCFLVSSRGDNLRKYTLNFYKALKPVNTKSELLYKKLTHAFSVFEPDLAESYETMKRMSDYFARIIV
jgi:hypothetical protein